MAQKHWQLPKSDKQHKGNSMLNVTHNVMRPHNQHIDTEKDQSNGRCGDNCYTEVELGWAYCVDHRQQMDQRYFEVETPIRGIKIQVGPFIRITNDLKRIVSIWTQCAQQKEQLRNLMEAQVQWWTQQVEMMMMWEEALNAIYKKYISQFYSWLHFFPDIY